METKHPRLKTWLKDPAALWRKSTKPVASDALSSIEYELGQLRRSVTAVQLEKKMLPRAPLPKADPEAFASKLRRPGNRRNPKWWAVLGLNQ